MSRKTYSILATLAVLVLMPCAIRAGNVTSGSPVPNLITNPPDSNSIGTTANKIRYTTITLATAGPWDAQFSVDDNVSFSPTAYLVRLGPLNNSPQTWTGLDVILGDGVGDSFVRSAAPNAVRAGLQFDYSDPLTMPFYGAGFAATTLEPTLIEWPNVALLPNNKFLAVFGLDVPNSGEATPTSYTFTLRMVPLVPEPATLLLVLGMAPLLVGRVRHSA